MQLLLYRNTIPLDHIYRSFNDAQTLTGYLKDSCDILNPDIVTSFDSSLLNKNYCYIADFGRYYFYRQAPTIDGREMILHLHADALYNYRNVILNSQCIAERSSSKYDTMLPDSVVKSTSGYNYYTSVLPFTFTPENGSYILTVAGGV